MKKTLSALVAALALAGCQPPADKKEAAPAATAEGDTFYAIGLSISKSLQTFEPSAAELDLIIAGMKDAAAGKPRLKLEDKMQAVNQLAQARTQARSTRLAAAEKEKGPAYLEKMLKEPGATKTASGLVYIPVQEGKGPNPAATDTVKVSYKGTLVDGTVFDASEKHGGPATFPLSGVIPCWTEGMQKVKVGGKAKLVCPPEIAYGERGAGSVIPPGATLTFEVELVEIVKQ